MIDNDERTIGDISLKDIKISTVEKISRGIWRLILVAALLICSGIMIEDITGSYTLSSGEYTLNILGVTLSIVELKKGLIIGFVRSFF
ncbi:TPA: hypothetical protein NJ731_004608 [Vibrio parahaemolyticus]|nr:hypothetical protein [Vibrio parahaemolyticus]